MPKPAQIERAIRQTRVQIRSSDREPNMVGFVGYASTVGDAYDVRDFLGSYRETIVPNAFRKTLKEHAQEGGPGVPLLIDHDPIQIVASTKRGTSKLSEDATGLRNEANLDRRQVRSNDLVIALERGDVDQMSFSFRAIADDWNDDYSDRQVRELQLYDTSVVTFPANSATTAGLRSAAQDHLGREGVWRLSELRNDLPAMYAGQIVPEGEELLEKAMLVFDDVDAEIVGSFGPQCRGRNVVVARSLIAMRKGKVLSASNHALLTHALDALTKADKHHQAARVAIGTAIDSAVGTVESGTSTPKKKNGASSKAAGDGKGNGTPPGNGNPINPADGAGPRSAHQAAFERERQKVLDETELKVEKAEFERSLAVIKAQARVKAGTATLKDLKLLRKQGDRNRGDRDRDDATNDLYAQFNRQPRSVERDLYAERFTHQQQPDTSPDQELYKRLNHPDPRVDPEPDVDAYKFNRRP